VASLRHGEEAANKLLRIKNAEVRQVLGPQFDTITQEQHDVTEAIVEPADRMLALPARTIEGLTLKAVFAAYENMHLWQRPFNDLDWTDRFLRHLVEAALAAAGMSLPFAIAVVGHAPHPDEMEPLDPVLVAIEKHREAFLTFWDAWGRTPLAIRSGSTSAVPRGTTPRPPSSPPKNTKRR
jgi:hypothetical protein